MQINSCNTLNYRAKGPDIRFADDIARYVNNRYPRISATKMQSLNGALFFPELIENLISLSELNL